MRSKRLRIGVDVDDVLAAQVKHFVKLSNEVWGTNLTVDDYNEDWTAIWGTTYEETQKRADVIHTKEIMGEFEYLEDSQEILAQLAKHHDLFVVTARRTSARALTEDWIERHYPGVFREIHLAGLWDTVDAQAINLTKAGLCEQLDLDYLIDDQLKHCLATAERGISAIIFGDYSWNHQEQIPENVKRCHSWAEVGKFFGVA